MPLENFIPTIWSARLADNLTRKLVYGQTGVVNRNWEGEIRDVGDSVRINDVGPVNVFPYAKNVPLPAPQVLDDASQVLIIDQSNAFNFAVDDIDRAQQKPDVMDRAMERAANGLRDAADRYLADLMWQAVPAAATQGAVGAGITIGYGANETNPYVALLNMATDLDEADVPREGRWVIVPPWFHGYLLMDPRFVGSGALPADRRLRTGMVGQAAGFDVLLSNNVPSVAGPAEYKIIAGTDVATTYAEQIRKVEAYRPESAFADAVKGLHLFGARVVIPDALALLIADVGTAA